MWPFQSSKLTPSLAVVFVIKMLLPNGLVCVLHWNLATVTWPHCVPLRWDARAPVLKLRPYSSRRAWVLYSLNCGVDFLAMALIAAGWPMFFTTFSIKSQIPALIFCVWCSWGLVFTPHLYSYRLQVSDFVNKFLHVHAVESTADRRRRKKERMRKSDILWILFLGTVFVSGFTVTLLLFVYLMTPECAENLFTLYFGGRGGSLLGRATFAGVVAIVFCNMYFKLTIYAVVSFAYVLVMEIGRAHV